jgi:hypothetical protein
VVKLSGRGSGGGADSGARDSVLFLQPLLVYPVFLFPHDMIQYPPIRGCIP